MGDDTEVSSSKGERFDMGGGSGFGSSSMPDPDAETANETTETETTATAETTASHAAAGPRIVTDQPLFEGSLPLLHTRQAKGKGIEYHRPDRLTIDVQATTDTLVTAMCRTVDDHFADYSVPKGDAYEAIVLNGVLKTIDDGLDAPFTEANLDIEGVVAALEHIGYGYDE